MPLLGPDDPLPARPSRVLVAGTSGVGKTTLARRIADVLAVPHVEIDALYHGPQWVPRPSFVEDVQCFSAEPGWVTEWQYDVVRPLLADRADVLVWLDLPSAVALGQVVRRTVERRLHRTQLFHGNREPPLRTFFTDREHVVRWAWATRQVIASRVGELLREHPERTVVRLRSHRQAHRWLAGPLRRSTGARTR